MPQRHDIVRIDFQANARNANAAIEAMRQRCDECNIKVKQLKDELKNGIKANLPADQLEKMRTDIASATKETKQWTTAYKQLIKGMRTLDEGIKAFNDGSLGSMSAAFQKAVYNAAKLTRTKLDPLSESYKRDKQELTALMDASQQFYARLQADTQQVIHTIEKGGKVSRQAITEELQQARELLSVLSEQDAGYKQAMFNVAKLEHYLKAMGGSYEFIRKNISDTRKVSDETLRNTLSELQKTNNEGKVTRDIMRDNSKFMREIRTEQAKRVENVLGGDLGKQSEGNIRAAIASAKELMQVYGTSSKKARDLSMQIVNAEEYLKTVGVEGARAAQKQAEADQQAADKLKLMRDRMGDLSKVTAGGLAETQKYWQAQMDGAARGTKEFKNAEAALRKVNDQINVRTSAQAQRVLSKPDNFGDAEIRQAITTMEKLRDAQAHSSTEWDKYNKLVEQGKKYLDEWARTDAVAKYEGEMSKLATISDAALANMRKFWETTVANTEKGSAELQKYEDYLKKVKAVEDHRRQSKNLNDIDLLGGHLSDYSEAEIRHAIEAGKQLIQTFATGSSEAKTLARYIVDAEKHLEKYGISAERAAQREADAVKKAAAKRAESVKLMETQLKNLQSEMVRNVFKHESNGGPRELLSDSALKAQQSYWQRLIDDPKTASGSLDQYKANLKEVQELMKNNVRTKGRNAFDFFQGDTSDASADEIKTQAAALKKWRDQLPAHTSADLIQQIDELLGKVTPDAKEATDQIMSLQQALAIGQNGIKGQFSGTNEQLKQAKKILEDTLAVTPKGTQQYNEIRAALEGVALEEKRVGTLSEQVRKTLDNPKGKSFNELKLAVEEGRKSLNSMDRTTKEGQQAFDELAKKVKACDLEMKNLAGESKGTESAFAKAWSRFKTYVTFYVSAATALQKVGSTVHDLMELSDKMGEVRKTTGFTADQVGRLSDNLAKMDTRTPLTELMGLSAAAGQLGLKTEEDVRGFTEAANMMLVALPEMGQEGATQMLKVALATGETKKIEKQMREGLVEGSSATAVAMEKIASTIDRLRATTAAAAPPITDFVKRVGAVGAQSGISIDQIAALGATVDSLGMGTEMAATALSRMIPAIKANAFDIAQAIGVTPDTLRELFDAGKGMEAMLMIFQHMKDSNMDADSIDKMLNLGGMQDIMKELNQRGARAGIVFAGLSQNVDELRKNLDTANVAYEQGTAIMDEYNKMNDTTAGKWQRLTNQVEEFFVRDSSQAFLGHVIDLLRGLVNLLTGDNGVSVALRAILLYLGMTQLKLASIASGAFVAIKNGIKNIGVAVGFVQGQMTKMQMANIFTALATAVLYAVMAFKDMKSASQLASEALGKAQEEVRSAINKFEGYWKAVTDADAALQKTQKSHTQLSAEVDKLRRSTDKNSASTELLTKKEAELKASENTVKKATDNRRGAIRNINAIYGKYLGFILTERNYALLAAAAHDKVTAAIKREMLAKQKQAAIDEVDSQYTSEIAEDYGDLSENLTTLGKLTREQASTAMADLQKYLRTRVTYDGTSGKVNINGSPSDNPATAIAGWFYNYLRSHYHINGALLNKITGVEQYKRWFDGRKLYRNIYTSVFSSNARADYIQTFLDRMIQEGKVSEVFDVDLSIADQEEKKADQELLMLQKAIVQESKATIVNKKSTPQQISEAYDDLANALELLQNQMDKMDPSADAASIQELQNLANSIHKTKGIDKQRLKTAQGNIHSTLFDRATGGDSADTSTVPTIDPGPTTNPWGEPEPAVSTDWTKMNAKELVERRKQMNNFVKALQEDTDVESVLAEDPALKKAIEKGMSKDMRTVISWYNTQRLKIQDELHARFLTNTGNWLDPKNKHAANKAQKMVNDEIKYYLDELDAYYTERKARIEQAQADGDITEAEGWRRTLQNDQIWQQRRGELQQLYTDKRLGVATQEADAIYAILDSRTGEGVEGVKATIDKTIKFIEAVGKKKGDDAMKRILGELERQMEQSFMKSQSAVAKQMAAIAEIISKERPFDGIVTNLRTNVEKMGVIQGDLEKRRNELLNAATVDRDALANLDGKYEQELRNRLTFLLQESEDAYNMTWERLKLDMQDKGYWDWLDSIVNSKNANDQKEALLAQLRSVYDAVQDAIKKESDLVKKQVEITWNNAIIPGIDGENTSMKSLYEKTAAALGAQQNRVNTANSLVGAGAMSSRVADKLALKQMQVQLQMQNHYFNLMQQIGLQRVRNLQLQAMEARAQGKINDAVQLELDAKHAQTSLDLSRAEETSTIAKLQEEIDAKADESRNRLYTTLRELSELIYSSVQSVFEASNTGLGQYYDSLAKMRLTGEGSAGGTYVVIDNAGTKDAEAHYETLNGEDALKRQMEIEQQNAVADAWRKIMDDINKKMSDTITDFMNAQLQNGSIDANTAALVKNTAALYATMGKGQGGSKTSGLSAGVTSGTGSFGGSIPVSDTTEPDSTTPEGLSIPDNPTIEYIGPNPLDLSNPDDWSKETRKRASLPVFDNTVDSGMGGVPPYLPGMENAGFYDGLAQQSEDAQEQMDVLLSASKNVAAGYDEMYKEQIEGSKKANKVMTEGAQSSFAKMTQAANLYGIAYQAMSNDNLSASQKFQLMAVQAAGQAAITSLTVDLSSTTAQTATESASVLSKLWSQLGYWAIPVYALFTGLLGGLMGLAVSKIGKSKSEISQATGVSAGAGRLSTGMLTYAEGNVNEFTDPSTLTPGKSYNVDGADGRTYRAKYTGDNPRTHITNGPEFHLVGERGREAIIDAHTTRLLQMDDTGIWKSIQTLYNGGGLRSVRRRGRGVRAFAGGNLDDFESVASVAEDTDAGSVDNSTTSALQTSIDRNNELLERALNDGIKGVFNVYGKDGLIDSYDRGKKTVESHGERY